MRKNKNGIRILGSHNPSKRKRVCLACLKIAITTEHHLVPRSEGGEFLSDENLADLCEKCHIKLHKEFDNKYLADHFHAIESLYGLYSHKDKTLICSNT